MAGAEKLLEKILDEAKKQAGDSVLRAKDEADLVLSSAAKDAESKKADILSKANTEALEIKRRKAAVAGLENRKRLLKARQDMVEEAFSKALSHLCSMPQSEYEDMLVGAIINTAKTGREEVILSKKDKTRLSGNFAGRINNGLSAKGIAGSVKISNESGNFSGGFILRTEDIEINNSFEALIKMNRDELETQVVKELFS
jgi:V/A-type H+-transporting ATPase subunit E